MGLIAKKLLLDLGFYPLKAFLQNVPKDDKEVIAPAKTFLWVYSNQNGEGTFEHLIAYKQFFCSDKECSKGEYYLPSKDSKCIGLKLIPLNRKKIY